MNHLIISRDSPRGTMDVEAVFQLIGHRRVAVVSTVAAVKAACFAVWPDGRDREDWRDLTCCAVRPRWLRYANYSGTPEIVEFMV